MKKKKITLIILCVCLVVISVVYFAVVAPLIDSGDGGDETDTPEAVDGEGIYLKKISLYPEIDKSLVTSIEVENEKGTFSFVKTWDKDKGKYEMKLDGHEKLSYDSTYYAYLIAYVCSPSTIDVEPMRNLTNEDMEQYGVTEELCLAKYTVTYEDENGEKKSYTVRIGEKAPTSSTTYYVAVDGRNSVYRMQDGVEKSLLLSLEDYVTPIVLGEKYNNSSEALLATNQIFVYTSDGLPIWQVTADEKTETTATFKLTYPRVALADANYLLKIVNYLYCGFSGEATVCTNVTDEALKEYGLSPDDKAYLISADFDDGQTISLAMSEAVDGYRYLVSYFYGEDAEIIVKIPDEKCTFLKSDDASLLKLAATNTVQAGFYKYINANEEAGQSGVKNISIKMLIGDETFEDTFILNFDGDDLTVTSKSGKYTFKDDNNAELKKDINQFRNFYSYLTTYPMSVRFNRNTVEEIKDIRKEENIIFELVVEMNDGELLKYTYYKIDSSAGYAMRETASGTSADGLGGSDIVFDVAIEQINKIASALKKLINGEKVNTDIM